MQLKKKSAHFSPADCIKEKEFSLNLNSFCSMALICDEFKIIYKNNPKFSLH
jgi:hypothetical protein